jgi:epoxyqueuosine reductase
LKISDLHKEKIKQKALSLGFNSIGVAQAVFLEEEAPRLDNWLKNGYHGKMAYMENHFDKRLDPTKLVEGAKSVISLSFNYYPRQLQEKDTYKIAKYAYGKDYHFVLKDKLKDLCIYIESLIGTSINGRIFTDSAPVLERAWATKSGIGWQGKHSLVIQKNKGSFFFLAEIISDLDFETYDTPFQTDHCGSCTRCIDVCPTDAILDNKMINASKCISYFTIELKDELPADMKGKFEDWMFGCDMCQDVCPWNKFSLPHNEPAFEPHPDLLNMTKHDWEEITEEVFRDIFRKSAVKRTKYSGLTRNINFLKK